MLHLTIIYPHWSKLPEQTEFHLPPHGPVCLAASIPEEYNTRLWPFFDYYKTRKIKELAARFGNYKHSYPDFLWVDLIQFKLDIIISVS
ncbi:MAG: hypothetical protein C4B58_06485 [Deltaproteobacteria bacterium]|nr:MAG: hypothetical protein C4B58_06485 [Deltaproteobacteria bacterium]